MKSGCILVLNSWSDTFFPVKHAYVDEFVEVNIFSITGFTYTLGKIYNLLISHVFYKFYKEDGTVVFLENNNTIYMGDDIICSLANPIKCEDNYVKVELRTKLYYHNKNNEHFITFPDGTSIPVE